MPNFINFPKERIVPGRLHSELCAWGIKRIIEKSLSSGRFEIIDDRYENQHLKFNSGKYQNYCINKESEFQLWFQICMEN